MNLFETVKASVSVPDAAKMYGLRPNHHSMVRCPLHDDRHPSLKLNEDYFYCFGCGATGDVIDLTERLFELSPYEAYVEYLADILTVGTLEQRATAVKDLMKDGMIGGLEEKIRRDCTKKRGITEYGENERIAG